MKTKRNNIYNSNSTSEAVSHETEHGMSVIVLVKYCISPSRIRTRIRMCFRFRIQCTHLLYCIFVISRKSFWKLAMQCTMKMWWKKAKALGTGTQAQDEDFILRVIQLIYDTKEDINLSFMGLSISARSAERKNVFESVYKAKAGVPTRKHMQEDTTRHRRRDKTLLISCSCGAM